MKKFINTLTVLTDRKRKMIRLSAQMLSRHMIEFNTHSFCFHLYVLVLRCSVTSYSLFAAPCPTASQAPLPVKFSNHLAGVLLCCLAYQAFKGPPWLRTFPVGQCVRCLRAPPTPLGSFSVAQCVRCLKGPRGWSPSLLLGGTGT